MKDKKELSRIRRLARASGARFETKVREDLIEKGWIVDKWTNNLELIKCDNENGDFSGEIKLVKAKPKFVYNPAAKRRIPMGMSSGFPDFITLKLAKTKEKFITNWLTDFSLKKSLLFSNVYEVIGVESKVNGYLTKEEREKCKWLLDKGIFSKILIASKEKSGRKIVVKYEEFK